MAIARLVGGLIVIAAGLALELADTETWQTLMGVVLASAGGAMFQRV